MSRQRGFVPQPNCTEWPIERQLELNWIIGELNWIRATRHPHLCQIASECPVIRKRFPSLRITDTALLGAVAHDFLCQRILSTSPSYNIQARNEAHRLLADTARDFNRTVLSSDADYPTDSDSPWSFKYWSYLRWHTLKVAGAGLKTDTAQRYRSQNRKESADVPIRYHTPYLTIDGVNRMYLDNIRRAHLRPIAVGEVPEDERIPPTLS